jgi:hypothetical protein
MKPMIKLYYVKPEQARLDADILGVDRRRVETVRDGWTVPYWPPDVRPKDFEPEMKVIRRQLTVSIETVNKAKGWKKGRLHPDDHEEYC